MNSTPAADTRQPGDKKHPIINCHSHVFTGDHVPPWLAKTFLVWPVYYLLPVSGVVALFRWWFATKGPNAFFFGKRWEKIIIFFYNIRMFLVRNRILRIVSPLIGAFLTINVFFFLYHVITRLFTSSDHYSNEVGSIECFFINLKVVEEHPNVPLMLLFILLMFCSINGAEISSSLFSISFGNL